jgi:hypothetical protein
MLNDFVFCTYKTSKLHPVYNYKTIFVHFLSLFGMTVIFCVSSTAAYGRLGMTSFFLDNPCIALIFFALNVKDRSVIMSNLNTPGPIPSRAIAAETHVPDGHCTPITAAEPKKKCLVLSLVRHAEVRPLLFLILNPYFRYFVVSK